MPAFAQDARDLILRGGTLVVLGLLAVAVALGVLALLAYVIWTGRTLLASFVGSLLVILVAGAAWREVRGK
jgi:hypothetical protein